MKTHMKKTAFFILGVYLLVLSYWMFFGFGRKPYDNYMYNLIPFATINQFLKTYPIHSYPWLINIVGNICIFIPFGIVIPIMDEGKYVKGVIKFLSGLFVLETMQLLTRRGIFDMDDFFLNTIGFTIGCGIYKILAHKFKSE